MRIEPEPTYHKIRIKENSLDKDVYLMRVNGEWVPFHRASNSLQSYHPPANHHVVVRVGEEDVHIKHRLVSPALSGLS